MAYKIVLKRRALDLLWEAMNYYREQSPGLEQKLMDNFFARLEHLKENPERFGFIYEHFRRIPLNGFPYKIIFSIDPLLNRVVVLVLWHEKRNPETLIEWLKE